MLLLCFACGTTKKNSATTRFYQGLTTRYNVYFNGHEAYKKGIKSIEMAHKDPYMEFFYLLPISEKKTVGVGTSDFDRAIEKSQKAIKLHSIKKKPARKPNKAKDPKYKRWMAQKEYNPFLHHAWLLMGEAQFHKGEFMEAATTFSYISRLYATNLEVSTRAKIWLAQCYTENGWYYESEDLLQVINSDTLPISLIPLHQAAYGNYLIHQKRYKESIPYLLSIIDHEKRGVQKTRIYYLLGQVYQETGENESAYRTFGKVIKRSPPYEMALNARIKQSEVIPKSETASTLKSLNRMVKESKNKEYLDQLYYAIGNVYLANQDSIQAIQNYELGVKKSSRKGIELGVLQIVLGDVYWQKHDFVATQPCYSGALKVIDKEHKEYDRIFKRSEILDKLVVHVQQVALQDSLQKLAAMTEPNRLKAIQKLIDSIKQKEEQARQESELEALLEKRAENEANAPVKNSNKQTTPQIPVLTTDNSWYFYNPQLVSQGKTDFQRVWGKRKLEDNWRRKNKTVIQTEEFAPIDDAEKQPSDSLLTESEIEIKTPTDSLVSDDKSVAFYLQQIPLTPQAMLESNELWSDALFNMAMIYKDQLEDVELANEAFLKLINRFPDFAQLDEVYYQFYLLLGRNKQLDKADVYKAKLMDQFPTSKYALTLADPDFFTQAIHGKQLEDSLYAATYSRFLAGDYPAVKANYSYAKTKYPLGAHFPKFLYLNAFTHLQTGDNSGFLTDLKELVTTYQTNEIAEIAGAILKGLQEGRVLKSASLGSIWNRRLATMGENEAVADSLLPKFSADPQTEYLFILAFEAQTVNDKWLLYEVAKYNFSNFLIKSFDHELVKTNGIEMLQVKSFINLEEAQQYLHKLYADPLMAQKLEGIRAVLISNSNYELLKKYYSFEEYDLFYKQELIKTPQVSDFLLDQPVYSEDEHE